MFGWRVRRENQSIFRLTHHEFSLEKQLPKERPSGGLKGSDITTVRGSKNSGYSLWIPVDESHPVLKIHWQRLLMQWRGMRLVVKWQRRMVRPSRSSSRFAKFMLFFSRVCLSHRHSSWRNNALEEWLYLKFCFWTKQFGFQNVWCNLAGVTERCVALKQKQQKTTTKKQTGTGYKEKAESLN